MIIYRGPSMLDGQPIVVVATQSKNEKTGAMLQTWIMRDDVEPHLAVKTGEDASVCGDCMHRPANGGSCYVLTFQAPLSVYRTVQRGRYVTAATAAEIALVGAGETVRLGSYGDPAAVPVWVWDALVSQAKAWTGYTHQWLTASDDFKRLCMASADSESEAAMARAFGWRTFRVRTADEPLMGKQEIVCPASDEAGNKTDCISCKACMGTASKAKASPVIIAHGSRAKRFTLTRNGAAVVAA